MKHVKVFEDFLNEETADNGDTLGELNDMTLGQLERISDYAKMIKDRMMKGEKLESWMYSQLTIALENLNSVHDAMDGNDGTVEEREVSSAEREKLADKGFALPNGSYPIANVEDLKNAVSAFGRSNPEDRKEVAQHIAKRAKALGKEDLIPQTEIFQKALKESIEEINEAKLNRDQMMDWIRKSMKFVRTTEEFNGSKGGIWVSGENGDTFKGKPIYDYYAEGSAYELGVLAAWEKELNNRGWYSEWNDPGTVMVWPE